MALSAGEMQEAIIRNLKEKTGHDLAQWREIIRRQGNIEVKPIVTWLRQEHALGHITAQTIAAHLNDDRSIYAAETGLLDAMFAKGTASRMIYESFDQELTNALPTVERVICKTYIAYRQKTQIAAIRPAGMKAEVAVKLSRQSDEQSLASGWCLGVFRGGGSLTHSQKITTKDIRRIVHEIRLEVSDAGRAT